MYLIPRHSSSIFPKSQLKESQGKPAALLLMSILGCGYFARNNIKLTGLVWYETFFSVKFTYWQGYYNRAVVCFHVLNFEHCVTLSAEICNTEMPPLLVHFNMHQRRTWYILSAVSALNVCPSNSTSFLCFLVL